MICPECGAKAQSGKAGDVFRFHQGADTPAPGRWHSGPLFVLEVRAEHCGQRRCGWFGMDWPTLKLRWEKSREWQNAPVPADDWLCPDCGQSLMEGVLFGMFHFLAESTPRDWRQIFVSGTTIYAKAPAQYCGRCGWIGVLGSRFVKPAFLKRA